MGRETGAVLERAPKRQKWHKAARTSRRPRQLRAEVPREQHTDERLLADYLCGDQRSFTTLVARYRPELVNFLTRLMNDHAAAEDVFQETFLRVARAGHQFERQRDLRPWVYSIASNAAKDLHRWNNRRPALSLDAPVRDIGSTGRAHIDFTVCPADGPETCYARREMGDRVRHVVSLMPDPLREIIGLAYFRQLPYRDISATLGIPLGTVKSRLHSAVAHFAGRWSATQLPEE